MTEIIAINTPDRGRQWTEAFHLWLASLRSDSTRRAYKSAWQDLLGFLGDVQPWRIGRSDISRWVAHLHARGLSKCSCNLKLCGISSFYIYCMTEYTIITEDGLEVPLHSFNPAAGKSLRSRINPYGKACSMSLDEVKRFLGAIDRRTLQGLRDYALFLCYLFTARRNSEIRKLRWGDIELVDGRVWYKWSGKGKTEQRHEIAIPAYQAICNYLKAADTFETIEVNDFIFTSLTQNARRLPCARDYDSDLPLSMREVGKLLKTYCRKAGLDATKYHPHSLRHTAAFLRRRAGDDLETVSRMLSHSSLAITQIYLHSVEGQEDKSWQKVHELLGGF